MAAAAVLRVVHCRLHVPFRAFSTTSMPRGEVQSVKTRYLTQGFIRPSCRPYGAPVLFVTKKDGRWRMCVDYRALNKQMVKDRYPLPWIDLLLDHLGQARVFSKLDLAQGYHQIAMAADSVDKTAFCTNMGQWEYLVMPFGYAMHLVFSKG